MVQKVVSRESFNYRKLTDVAVGEEDPTKPGTPIEIDEEKLAAGETLIHVNLFWLSTLNDKLTMPKPMLPQEYMFIIGSICLKRG